MRSDPHRVSFEPIEPRLMLASISGIVFNDLDGDRVRNGEPALAGWTVFLDLDRNNVLDEGEPTALTNPSGEYTFTDVAPGNYAVAQVIPPGWQQTHPGGAPTLSAPVPFSQGLAANPRSARDSDAVRGAIRRLSSLGSYTREQLLAAKSWVVGIPEGAAIDALAAALGAISVVQSPVLSDTYILSFPSRALGTTIASRLRAADDLDFFYPLIGAARPTRAIPDDTLFADQWHLSNTGQTGGTAGADANITSVWDTYRGDGVVIAIVDEGMEYTHEDLSPNYSAELSWDYWSNDSNPAASGFFEDHATAVAGVAAGRGFNGIGISGAAPNATLAALRLIVGFTSDLQEANALSHQSGAIAIYNNSWGPSDDGTHIEGPGPLTAAVLQDGALTGRGGLGNLFVWAAGNGKGAGGGTGDNVNYDGYANSRFVIPVSAIDHNGIQSWYSEPGAPILVAAYSDGNAGIVTTDRAGFNGYSSGNYTGVFGGTSSAAPLVAGIVALMLEANPDLTWRDVQHILAHSARQNHASDPEWTVNGAGMHISHKYGFGAVDAAAAVALAENWSYVGPEQLVTSGTLSVGAAIPDNNAAGLTRTFEVTSGLRVENVEVVLNVSHTFRGQLRVILTSPSGTQSILADVHNDSGDHYNNWVFSTRRNWNELAAGTWTLKVVDAAAGTAGTWNSWKLNLYGTTPNPSVYTVVVNDADSITGFDFGARDIAFPTIASSLFHFLTGQSITVQFSEDVSGSLDPSDLALTNVTTAAAVSTASIAVSWDGLTNTATFTFPGFAGGILPDGDYEATIVASGIADLSGNVMLIDGELEFFVLAGDANRDRAVDVADLGILAGNWQQSDRDFSTGDFDHSGTVDVADLGILASNWQASLPDPSAPATTPFSTSRGSRTPVSRVADQVL